ncbi:MAG: hypothetical protein PHQ23_13950, partial [Candidatus Wallbacteria bacterium]|nr:hypothetical protein [Candidatus Wallbacteria bacterium]
QIVIGYILARIFVTLVMIPRYFAGAEIYSPYRLISDRFGSSARTLAVYLIMISGFLAAGVRVYATAIPLKLLLNIDIGTAIIIFSIVAIIYTYMGGIKAVIWTDVAQFFVFVGGGLFALCYMPSMIEGGFGTVWETVTKAGKTACFDWKFSLSGDFNIWMGIIGATFLCATSHGADQLLVQRILACRNKREGQKAMMFSAIVILPIFLMFLLIGLMLWVFYQHHAFGILQPVDAAGKFKPDYIFPVFIITQMPSVIKGLLIAAIFAAAMSSIDSALCALSSIFVMDIHKEYFEKGRDEKYYIDFSKKTILLFGVVLTIVAFLCQNVTLIFNLAFKLTGITSGAVLGAMLFAIVNKRDFKSWPVMCGMLLSTAVMAYVVFYTSVHWAWLPFFGTAITMSTAYLLIPFSVEMNGKGEGHVS